MIRLYRYTKAQCSEYILPKSGNPAWVWGLSVRSWIVWIRGLPGLRSTGRAEGFWHGRCVWWSTCAQQNQIGRQHWEQRWTDSKLGTDWVAFWHLKFGLLIHSQHIGLERLQSAENNPFHLSPFDSNRGTCWWIIWFIWFIQISFDAGIYCCQPHTTSHDAVALGQLSDRGVRSQMVQVGPDDVDEIQDGPHILRIAVALRKRTGRKPVTR